MVNSDEKLYALLIYLLSFPFPILGPLIIWLLKREESEYVDFHGKEYCNFFISYVIYFTISGVLTVLLIGFVLLPIVGLMLTIFTIIAAVKSYSGERYRIPLIFHFIK
ncbi:DUF4870 domain-containing protein [Aquibacillus koreensis]|uniref:DUF4870 domain-containing protein n=1 Tax=Aquibacillus koreensis TaxID=279446 RepID=A0A9X3WSL3_9BACI|nr:DUF4870 domain-containing protein [Aquibacillus koreensis]MCT2537901.1 DUF4870 domain-containing protein [Aquibacillus koreensis]MDC3422669.1 DUF4870 domain-containing protein [Aquibacillus koreensis]